MDFTVPVNCHKNNLWPRSMLIASQLSFQNLKENESKYHCILSISNPFNQPSSHPAMQKRWGVILQTWTRQDCWRQNCSICEACRFSVKSLLFAFETTILHSFVQIHGLCLLCPVIIDRSVALNVHYQLSPYFAEVNVFFGLSLYLFLRLVDHVAINHSFQQISKDSRLHLCLQGASAVRLLFFCRKRLPFLD